MIPLPTRPYPVNRESSELALGNNFANHIAARTTLHEMQTFHEIMEERAIRQKADKAIRDLRIFALAAGRVNIGRAA